MTSVGCQDPESGVFVPLIFMISSRSTEQVFNMLMQELRAQNMEFDPKLFLCDKDNAILNAIKTAFPLILDDGNSGTQLKLCHWHVTGPFLFFIFFRRGLNLSSLMWQIYVEAWRRWLLSAEHNVPKDAQVIIKAVIKIPLKAMIPDTFHF